MTIRKLVLALEEIQSDNNEADTPNDLSKDVAVLVNETETDKLIKAMKESMRTGEHTDEYKGVITSDIQAIKDEGIEVPSSSSSGASGSDSVSTDDETSMTDGSEDDFTDMNFDDTEDTDTEIDDDGEEEDNDPIKKPDSEVTEKTSGVQESFRSTSMDIGKYLSKKQRRAIALETSIYEAEHNTKMDITQHRNDKVFMDGEPLGSKIVNYAGNKLLDGASWAKDKAVEHGPDVIKKTLSLAVGAGSLASSATGRIKKWAYKKFKSFESTRKKLVTISEKLDSYMQAHPKSKPIGKFTEEKNIPMLKIGASVNIINNINTTIIFTDSGLIGISDLLDAESNNVVRLLRLDKDSSNTKYAGSGHFAKVLEKGSIDGYIPKREGLVSYVSSSGGLGDVRLMAYVPDASISNVDKLKSLYEASSMFLAMDVASTKRVAYIPFVDPKELAVLIAKAIELTDLCITHEKLYKSVDTKLNTLSNAVMKVGHSLKKKISNNDMEIASDSMGYVYMKMAFINKVYIPCAMDIHEYNIRVLHALTVFIEHNLKALND